MIINNYCLIVRCGVAFLAAAGHGRLDPPPASYGNDAKTAEGGTTETVCGVISSLERSSFSLNKGVMVVAESAGDGHGHAAADAVPPGFLRALQARHGQTVYTADVRRLLADARRQRPPDNGTDTAGGGGGGAALPPACRRPAVNGARDSLPVRSRYVVLFRGRGPAGPFDQLVGLGRAFWDVNVYYVFVVREFDQAARQMIHGVWRDLSIYKVIVVTPTVVKLLDPFVHHTVHGGRFTNVPLRSLERIPLALKSRTKNLRRFPLRFVISYRTPTVVAAESVAEAADEASGGDGTRFVGQDGTFAAVLAATMNATPVYTVETSANGKIHYGYKPAAGNQTTSYGTFAGVVDGRADVSVNGHFLKDYNCYSAELTRHITSDKVCLLAPKAGVIPPMMTVLMSFQREVWTMTAITCIIVTFLYYAAAALDTGPARPRPAGCDLGLEIFRMFIGAPTNRIFAHSCQRILTSFCLIFTLVILNAFQGSLVTFLNTPMHYPDINTFTDLKESNLPIRTSSISFKVILTEDPNLKSLANRLEKWAEEKDIHNSDGRYVGFQRVNVFNLEHFKDVLFVANRNKTRVLHTMHECLISYFISYVVHRHSPYKRRINTLLSWIDQAGLVIKWNSDVSKYIFAKYKPINPKDYETSKVFSVRDLEIAFTVLSYGIILSIAAFVIELFVHGKLKTSAPHSPHLPFVH